MRSVRINLSPTVFAGRRIAAVDELKGVGILLIIIYHSCGVLGAPNTIHGEIGVDIFLLLSGFTQALTSAEMPLGRFALRRFLRIYPSYWIALGLFIWMHYRYLGIVRPWSSIWQHIAGVHAFSRQETFADFTYAFWFVSMIVAAYVAFACIRRHLDNLSLVFAVSGLLTVTAAVVYQVNGNEAGLRSLAIRIPSFFAGVVAGRLLGAGTAEIRFNLLLGLGLICFYYLTFFRGITCDYTLPAIGFVLTWIGFRWLVLKIPLGGALLASFSLLGLISYEIYLFHQPLIRDYNLYVYHVILHVPAPTHEQLLTGIFLALGLTLAVSVAVHAVVARAFALLGGDATRRLPAGAG